MKIPLILLAGTGLIGLIVMALTYRQDPEVRFEVVPSPVVKEVFVPEREGRGESVDDSGDTRDSPRKRPHPRPKD